MQMLNTPYIIIQTLGGIGLFLLGMIVMTNSLNELAGNTIRRSLMRFTHTPLSGALSGAACTAIVQSSSATTIAAIGFVGAGLMSFPSALGIVFGANIGTTITGWLVAILGFKLQLNLLVLPLIFFGAILRLFAKNRLSYVGLALAGFGLIFVGITFMQQGMQGVEKLINLDHFSEDTLITRLQLVVIGIVFTLITQSSSAGVATALSALFAGVINFHQAAALVIGMDVGTTATAAMATIGGSIGARRTGFSHVIYNFFTAIVALIILTPFIKLWDSLLPYTINHNSEIALVAFHSTFNILGVIAILPFTRSFVTLIERIVPEQINKYEQPLDTALLTQPGLALAQVQKNIYYQLLALLKHIQAILSHNQNGQRVDLLDLSQAIDDSQSYVDQIHLSPQQHEDWDKLIAIVHSLDHLQRLHERCEEEEDRAITASQSATIQQATETLHQLLINLIPNIEAHNWIDNEKFSNKAAVEITELYEPLREKILQRLARGELDEPTATDRLEAIRWLQRTSRHIARIIHHYQRVLMPTNSKLTT